MLSAHLGKHFGNKPAVQPSCLWVKPCAVDSAAADRSHDSSEPSFTWRNSRSAPFEELLAASELPPSGPEYYAARRSLWLAPRSAQRGPPEPSTSRQRLEDLLNRPGAVSSEAVWKGGIEKVWDSLSSGARLKRPVPMNLILKVIHAAWIRDPETWPSGGVAPEPDDVLEASPAVEISHSGIVRNPSTRTEHSSGATTAWTPVSAIAETLIGDDLASGMVAADDR